MVSRGIEVFSLLGNPVTEIPRCNRIGGCSGLVCIKSACTAVGLLCLMPQRQPLNNVQQQAPAPGAGEQVAAQTSPSTFLWKWVGRSVLALLFVRALWFAVNLQSTALEEGATGGLSFVQRSSAAAQNRQAFYFYNEATGQVQWEDPGDVPYEDPDGRRYWFVQDGSKTYEDPGRGAYTWVEQFSPELQRAFFHNQETKESSWERPADLSWRRVAVDDEQ